LLLVITGSVFAQTVFFDGTLDQAIIKAQEERKYLFVDCYTDWCGWCKVADETTFKSETVGNLLNKRFVSIKLDMEREEGIDLGMKYRVFGFPSFLIFSPDGYIVNRIFGYTKNDWDFIERIKDGISDENKYRYQSNIRDGIKLPEFYTKSFANKDKDRKRVNPDPLQVTKWLKGQSDLLSEVAWCVISRFTLEDDMRWQFMRDVPKYRKAYGNEEVKNKVMSIANITFNEGMDKDPDRALEEVLNLLKRSLVEEKEKEDAQRYFQLKHAEALENWALYLKIASAQVYSGGIKTHLDEANTYAWTLYKKSDDIIALSTARDWMSRVVEADPTYAYTDTYAALLYKTGAYDEAASVALRAIEIGLANDEKVGETEQLLEAITKAQKKK
jgi:thioredoxin-related protein